MLFELGLAGDFPSAVRTNKFVTAPETAPKLASVSVALSIGIRVLGSFFKAASRYGFQQNRSILPLTFRSSPAKRAIDTALQHLGDERHASWVPLVGATFDWTSHLYLAGTVPMWVLVGNLFKRFVEDLNCFPWLWGALLDDDVDGVTKHSIAREYWDAEECDLTPFCSWLRSMFPSIGALLSLAGLDFLRTILLHTPAENTHSENRFSRQARHEHSAHGNSPAPATLASNHVLAEAKTILDTHVSCSP